MHFLRSQGIAVRALELERGRKHVPAVSSHELLVDHQSTEPCLMAKPVEPLERLAKPASGYVRICRTVVLICCPYISSFGSIDGLILLLGNVSVQVRGYSFQDFTASDTDRLILRADVDHPRERAGDDSDVGQPGVCRWRFAALNPRASALGRTVAVARVEEHVPSEIIFLRIRWWREQRVNFDRCTDHPGEEWLEHRPI